MLYEYKVKVDRLIDGDTFDAVVDLGFNCSYKTRFRMLGINAPEMRGSERAEGQKSKEWLAKELAQIPEVIIQCAGKDKYGRWLCNVVMSDGSTLNDRMIDAGSPKSMSQEVNNVMSGCREIEGC